MGRKTAAAKKPAARMTSSRNARPKKTGARKASASTPSDKTKAPKTSAVASRSGPSAPTKSAKPTADARRDDWRAKTLDRVRKIIRRAAPEAVEEVKWRKPSNGMAGVPTWSQAGLICTGETYKGVVKLTFARGASLEDPARLFNASLDGGTRRAIDLREGETINEAALASLIQEAVRFNTSGREAPAARRSSKRTGTR